MTHCPGEVSCSGHGVCSGSPTYTCECSDGWQGADCSLKTCPFGKSWFGRPTSDDVAHLKRTECSDMGACDRVSGECACVDGFEGAACDRMSCPGTRTDAGDAGQDEGGPTFDASSTACSGHGQCVTMAMLAEAAEENGVTMGYTYGGTPNDARTWDHDMVQGCLCDDGYEGHDCSLRSCPFGDDPDTHSQENEIQDIICLDADDNGKVVFTFRGAETAALKVTATEVCGIFSGKSVLLFLTNRFEVTAMVHLTDESVRGREGILIDSRNFNRLNRDTGIKNNKRSRFECLSSLHAGAMPGCHTINTTYYQCLQL